MTIEEALVSAVCEGKTRVVASLLNDGADPNTTFDDTRPPNDMWEGGHPWRRRIQGKARPVLHSAVLAGHDSVTRALLGRGAEPDAEDHAGLTALQLALRAGRADLVRALLDAGADPNHESGMDGLTPLFRVRFGPEGTNETASKVVRLLVAHGANPDARGLRGGSTPLMLAASSWNVTRVRGLLDAGADPDLVLPANDYTALTMAFAARLETEGRFPDRPRGQFWPTCEALLDGGARAEVGFNPLMVAAASGRGKWVQTALRWVSVNHTLADGRSALHVAAANGHAAVVRRLLKAGALAELQDEEGLTAYDLAAARAPSYRPEGPSHRVEPEFDATIALLAGE